MGCWGFGIRESDDALDFQCEVDDVAGLSGSRPVNVRERLENALPALFDLVERHTVEQGRPDYDRAVAHQVLAATLIEVGCAMTEETRTRLVEGARYCDEYVVAKNVLAGAMPDEPVGPDMLRRYRGRIAAIDALVEQLQTYDIAGGAPVEIRNRGLLDVLQEHLDADQQGLLNQPSH